MRIRIESDSIRFKSGMRRDRGFCPFCGFENKPLTGDAGAVIGGEQCEPLTKIRTDRCLNVHGDRHACVKRKIPEALAPPVHGSLCPY